MAKTPGEGKQTKTLDEYIGSFPETVQQVLQTMRQTIREVLPERATEAVRYNLAAFRLDGEDVIYFAGWKRHVSLYPILDEDRKTLPELFDTEGLVTAVGLGAGTAPLPAPPMTSRVDARR